MGAMVARGVEPVLKAFERLIAAGKPNKVASIAAARKLLIILSAIGHEGTPERDCGGSRAIHSEPKLGRSRPQKRPGGGVDRMRFILLVSSVGALGACKSACRQRQSLTL